MTLVNKNKQGEQSPFKTNIMKRKIENFIFDCIIYLCAFAIAGTFVYLCASADKWMGL
jgi:hypothetical protein